MRKRPKIEKLSAENDAWLTRAFGGPDTFINRLARGITMPLDALVDEIVVRRSAEPETTPLLEDDAND